MFNPQHPTAGLAGKDSLITCRSSSVAAALKSICPPAPQCSEGALGGGQRVCGAAGGWRHSARGGQTSFWAFVRQLVPVGCVMCWCLGHFRATAVTPPNPPGQKVAEPCVAPLPATVCHCHPMPQPARSPHPPHLSSLSAHQVVMLCCSIKPLCGWNNEECATTCRERCGGQGYLSCNRFGSILGFAHAGGLWGGCAETLRLAAG